MNEEDCRLCMFSDLRDNSNGVSVVDRLSVMTFGRIGPLQLGSRGQDSPKYIICYGL